MNKVEKALEDKGIVTDIGERWEQGLEHHPKTESIVDFICSLRDTGIDFGGDGDNGEAFAYCLDIYFESIESDV